MGYLKASEAPSGIEMHDSEMRSDNKGLLLPGEVFTPEADATYYARYRYDYDTEWTWDDFCETATVKISNPYFPTPVTLTATIFEDTDALVEPTDSTFGERFFNATATYSRGDGLTYQFTSQRSLVYFIETNPKILLDALDSDDENEAKLDQYMNLKVDVTLANFTLKKDNKIHPICLPFNVSTTAEGPLKGAIIYDIYTASLFGGAYDYTFKHVSFMEAGHPYFYRFADGGDDIVMPEFKDVIITEEFGWAARQSNWRPGDESVELWGTFEAEATSEEVGEQIFVMDGDGITAAPEVLNAFGNYFYIPELYDQEGNRKVRSVSLYFESDDEFVFKKKLAYTWDGNGTEQTPYIIYSANQLNEMREALNGTDAYRLKDCYFRQGRNIVFDKSVVNNFTPITYFNTHYDGNGYVISGLNIDRANGDAGLIEMALGGTVKNVIVANSTFRGNRAAAIAATLQTVTGIENCHVLKDVSIESTYDMAGGIVGYMNFEDTQVTGCSSQAAVTGYNGVGGIAGAVRAGRVSDCFYLGNRLTANGNRQAVVGMSNAAEAVTENLYYTAPTLSDTKATLMPAINADNTDFLNRLHQRDEFVMEHSGLEKQEINYDLALNGREFTATQKAGGTWKSKAYTVSLPFEMTIPYELQDNVKVYKPLEVDAANRVMTFTNEFPILKAGEPYLLVVEKGAVSFSAKNVLVKEVPMEPFAVYNTDASRQMGWWISNFEMLDNEQLVKEGAYVLQKNGTFRRIDRIYASRPYISPFHAYFSTQEPAAQVYKLMFVQTENGEESDEVTDFPADEFDADFDLEEESVGISEIENDRSSDGKYYDLQGRQLSTSNAQPSAPRLQKGIYIENGKKVVK